MFPICSMYMNNIKFDRNYFGCAWYVNVIGENQTAETLMTLTRKTLACLTQSRQKES